MRKMSNVKKAAILASVLGGCVFAGSAMAANLLVTVPSNYGSSNMAVITGSRVTDRIDAEPNRAVMTSLNRDPAAYSFVMDGKNKFILRQYTYDTIDLLPMILVDADTDWPKDGYISGTITKGANPHAAAGHNGYVYTGDYDLGTIAVAKVTNNALVEDVSKTRYLLEDINKYCEGDLDVSEGAWTHGESLLVKGNQLFAVVSVNATGGNTSYSSGYLLQYDIQADGSLKFVSFTRTGRNTDTVKLNSYNNLLINTAIGGMQNYGYGNSNSNVTIGVLNGGKLNNKNEVNASIVPENIKKYKLDFRDICVWPNGTAYILAYNLDGSGRGGSTFNIYKTTVANLNSATPKDWEIVIQDKTDGGGNTGVKTGWFNKIFAEYYTKRLWGEFGDNIVVYLDGDNNPSYTWSAYNLAGNSDYHTFNSVTQLAGDDVVGGLALLTKSREEGLTTPSATTSTIININANVKKADYQNRITGTTNDTIYSNITPDNSNYTFEDDKTISLNELAWKTQADLSNNILAAIYAHDGNDVTVNAGSNTLQMQVQNSVATPVGVYAGNGKNVTINAGKLNIITIGAVNGNSLNNAIMNDAGKSAASKITVNGDVNISMNGSYGGNGVAVQKTDRWGEASYASDVANTITINGNLTVKGADSETWGIPVNADNVLSRFNNAGILAQVENSRVDVSGTADMDVYGNGITTNAKNSTVSIGGGEINVPKGMNYGYYTLGAYQGTINVNTGKDGATAGSNSVKLGGDIFALSTGTVNVALTTGDSYLRGIVDNGGTVNMWLQNGASWINQANNTRYAQDNEDVGSNGASHISKLIGGSTGAAGVIFQKSDSKEITIDKYSGNTMVIYEHDNSNPENILGGNFTVKTAESGSAVALRTDSSGINTSSEATVNKVLDALANKLYYTDYVSGSRNLDGQVQIAEGLTAASAAQYIGNIEYSSTSGQGRLGEKIVTQLEVPKGDNVDNNKNFLVENDNWHGNNSGDKVNLTLKDKASWTGDNSGSNMVVNAADSTWTGDNKGTGTNVTLDTSSWEGNNEGGAAVVELKNKSNWSGDNSGNNANIVIDDSTWNGENIGKDAIITVRNNGSWNKDVKINNTKLTVDSASYNGHIVSDSNTINVQNSAQWSGNVSGKNNIITIQDAKWSGNNSGDSSTIDLLNAKWNGNSFGKDTKVAINSGSVWEGYNSGAGFDLKMASGSTWVITADSVVENLSSNLGRTGGTNPTIDMTNGAANATIGNYNGNFTLLYKHDYINPSQIQGGSFTINKAVDGSTITLLTDSSGIKLNDEDSVNDTLNALANKLYYQEAIDGKQNLSGSVKIVESLTAPEISKQTGSIIYNSTNGQGILDTNSVIPGFTYPKMQDKFVFNTTLTGDYKTDKEYRQHGVLTDDNHIYEFPLDPSTSSSHEKTTIVPENGNAISVNHDTTICLGRTYDLYLNAQKAPNIIVNNAKLNIRDAGTVYTGRDEIHTYDYKTRNEYQPGVIVNNGSLKIEGNLEAYGKVDDATPVITINGKDSSVEITKSLSIAAGRVVQYGDKENFSNKADVAVLADGGKLLVKSGVNISGSLHATNEGNIELRGGAYMTVMGDLIADKNAKIKLVSNQGIVDLDSNVSTDDTGEVILDFAKSSLFKNKWKGDNNGNTQLVMDNGEWRGNNNGIITASLANSATWNGANTGANATVNMTDSSWIGDNSGAGLSLTANNSKWNGSTSAAGSATLTNGSIWTGASTSADFALTLNGSTWNNSGASSLKSFAGTNGIVDMTNAAASVTIGSYSGDATVIYKHNSSNPGEVNGGNFTVNSAKNGSKITMLTDRSGVDTTDEDKINEALDALAGKLFYMGAIGGAESNLNGTVKIAEGLTATSVAKQTAGIVYDKTTGQGSADHKTVTPGPVYPTEQDRTAFVTSITGEHLTDKEYRKAGVLSNTVDNNIYNFTKDVTTITTDSSTITTAKDTTLKLNSHDMTITANSGDGIATTSATLTVQDAGNLTVSGAKAINANNSKVDITAVNATLNGDVTTNNAVNIKAMKAAKVNGAVAANGANSNVSISGEATTITGAIAANGANSNVSINGTASAAISGAVSADGVNAAVTIDSADTTIGSDITANGKGAKVTAKNLSKLDGDVATDADGSVELNFKEGASWTGDNSGNTTISLSKGTWNGANSGKVNATLTNGTTWNGTSSGAGSTIKLDASSWSGANSGANADITLSNSASWSKGNTADGVIVKADKATWTGANGGANANITLTNASTWNGTNTGKNATVNLTDSSWSGDNSGAGLSLTANNSKWNGNTSAAGNATLTNGSIWTGASTSADFALTLNGSTWNNSGASSLKSFAGTNGIVDMTNAAASVTIGSYSGDATVIYKHNSSNPGEVNGGNFTVNSAKNGSKITMLTDRSGVDTTDEDKINEALDALAGKLFYLGAVGGAESNLNGTVKISEGLTAASVAKQTAGIVYDKTTGQGSADHKTVTPGPVYPSEQDRTAFVTSITGEHLTDKEYRKAGVLSNTVDNNIYNFTKDVTTITTDSSTITTAKDTTLKLNSHDMTITANSGDGIATTGGKLTVQDAGNFAVTGAKAINANNSKVDITAVNATLNGDVSTNNVVNIKAMKAAKVNGAVAANGANSNVSISGEATTITGAVAANGANSNVSINGTASAAISGAVSAVGANAAVTIDSADTTIGSGITANGKGAKVTAKNLSKLDGDVATDADGSVELNFKEGASWTGDNAGNTTMSLSKGTWNGANTGKLNATLTNGTSWTGDSSGSGSTIKLEASTWSGANSGDNATITAGNGTNWSKGNSGSDTEITLNSSTWTGDNIGDGVTVKADKTTWTGANGGAKANITLNNATTWTGANTGSNATVSLTDSSWTGDNSGAGLSLTANNSKWNGSTSAAGSATLTNGSIWNGASTSADFSLTLNGSTWNNSGASSLKSFNATNGIVDMTNAAASVTIGSYSGDATVIYKHNSSNPAEVHGGNFTVNKAAANSKITMLTDNTGVDTTDEDKINEALDALAGKLFYTGAIGGAENNLNGTVKIAEGLTATSVAKQTAGIVYDKTTGQGSADHKTVTPGPVYPTEQDRTAFVTSITGEHLTDKEYRKAGILSNTVDNNIYNFTKDATTITTAGSAVTTAKDTTLKLNNNDMTITANSGDGIATTGATLTVQDAGNFAVTGAKAINANNSKVDITAVNATLNGDVTTNNAVTIKATKAAKVNGVVNADGANSNVSISGEATTITGAVAANGANSNVSINGTASAAISGAVSAVGANAAVTIDSADTTIGSGITANGKGAKVTAKNLSKLDGDVATDTDSSVELNFKEGASWTGDNSGNTTMSLSKGSWNGANTGKLNATLTNGTSWTGDSSGAESTIKLDGSAWNGANSGANADITLTNGASWSKGNTADGVTVKADKAAWTGANGGAKANITLSNSASWNGANTGSNATVNLTDSSWSGDNSGAGLSLTADNSKWNGSTSVAGSATLTNDSSWTGASTSADFALTLNGSTWNNSGASSLKSFTGTNGIVDMTNAAASVTIGSYSGDATVIYKHNSSDPGEVYGGNFTVTKAAANSKITMLTDNTGVDTTDEDKINEALDALAGKLFYTGAIGGAENNLNGTVKIAEGLTATSVAKQTAGIVYDKTTGQGSADHKTVTPGPVYPSEQDRTAFVTSITGEHLTDKEYRKAGVLSNTVDNNIYNFTKDATTITTDSSAITTAKDTTLKLNNNDMTITANSGDGIATTGGTLTVQNAGSLTVSGAKAINANNSKVEITAVNATLNGDVSTNNVVNIKATKAAKVNGAVSASGANSSVSINGTASAAISGAVSAYGANAAVTIDSADTIIGSDVTANGKGAKVTAKNLSKLDGNVATDADGSVELNFKEGASWTGDNSGNTTMSLSKGSWNGANTGKLNATLTNGTSWTGDSSGAGSTIKLDASTWNGANSGANADITLTNGASWSKGNTADGVTVKADKATWTGANSGANANITLSNSASWNGANTGSNATVNLTDSSWTGDNSGAGLSLTADNSKWNGSTNAAGSAVLINGSIWTGASSSADFGLTLNGSTWNNSGASSLKSFNATNGIVDMTNAAASVTIGSYSGDATVIYKHNSSNPAEVHGGNFTVTKAAANSKITMLTDNTGVDTTDEDKINEALDALAGKLFYTGAIGGAESNLNGTVKIAEGLTATSVAKQTAGIVYDKTTGQGSADHKTVTPGPVYPTEQDRTAFVTSITGEHFTDKEYRKAGVLSNTVDNNIYNFTKDATTITTDSSAITTAKDTTLKLNSHNLTITANSGDGIATTGGTLTVQDAGSLTVKGAKAINANNSKVDITAVNATLNGDVSTNNVVNIKATKVAKVNGAVSADGANAAVTVDSADTTIGSDITANGKGAKVTAKNLSKLDGNVATDADGSVELNFKEGASWTGDNSGNTTMNLSKGTWNGANTGKLNATLTNGATWTGDSSGAGSTINLDASSWSGVNSGANADITLTNGASWSKGNTADGVTVKADKATWTGVNGGAKANITLTNASTWNGANTGSDAIVNLTDSSWTGDNSGAGLSLTANNSKWNGSTSAAGSATLTNGSIWTGVSTSADFALTLNGSTWNNSGASSLKSFAGTNGIVDMTNAAASVTIGSYSGDATVIYKHNSSNPGEVNGGNFTVTKAAANSKITMLTDRSGVDFSDEDSIANTLNSLANKLYYTGYITGERNLTGYVKLAEGLTASSVVKQTGDIAYDKATGQGSLKDGSVTPNVTYPEAQTKDNFTSQITGEWKQDKEYKLAGVLHTDNAVYDFSKDRSIITTAGTSVGAGRDLQMQLNNKSMSLNSGADAVKADAITIEFKNLDKLDIKAADQALLAENGGKIILHNTGAVTADSAFVANGAGSGIKADGLTNITVGSGNAVKADAGSIELAGGTVKGDVTADNKGKISINANNNAAGSTLTNITGNVLATAGSSVDIGLGTADSKLTGDVSTVGDAVINIYADMGVWTGNADGDNVNLNLNSSKAQWNNIGDSKLRSLKGNGGIINQTDAKAGNIDVGDYSGNIVVNYKHTADKDTATNTLNNIKFGGGTLNIDKVAEGSSITLRTDNSDNLSYTETDNIEKLFRELSKKLYYADAGSNPDNLSGHVEIAEGLTKVKVYGDINYGDHGQGNYKDGSIKRTDPEIIYGSSETAMMRGAKSAMASTALLWRSENSDMLQRMGDVRLANEESGLWARYYGGKNSFDAKNTKYSTSFNAYQLGYDKQLDNNMLFGAAVSYNKGKNTYEMGGHGDGKAVSLSVYGSWNSNKGHYADVIVKGGKLDNDYTVYNDMGHKLEGDYDTWGLSLSAEYGRRMQMQNGFYVDPSVQFTVGRVAGADYSAASDFLDSKGLKKDMYVSQDAFTSAIGRIGLGIGKTTDKSMFYTKFALAHEFSGDFTTTFAAENEPTSSTAVDFGGTWFEWQLGGSMKVNDNSYVYATFEKKFGGDTGSNDWRLDAGLRWSF